MNRDLIKENTRLIIERLLNSGHQVCIVGGAVRDVMLGKPAQDIDLLTTAALDKIVELFSDQNVKKVGKSFPLCIVNHIEVASSRGAKDLSNFPESDLSCRDFTINAMAFDPAAQKIFDPFNGRKDLEKSIVRFTKNPSERIKEDPVRMVRACRFAAMIQGSISISSFNAVQDHKDLLENAAKERIQSEILKAMALKKPSLFFRHLAQTGLLAGIFQSLDRCINLDGGPHHGESVFEHCLLVGDALPADQPLLRLSGFLHDTGKYDAAETKDGQLTFPGHEKHIDAVINDLAGLRFSQRDMQFIRSVILSHMRPLTPKTTDKAVRRLLAMLESHDLDFRTFLRMRIADKKGNLAKPRYTLSDIRTRLGRILSVLEKKPPLGEDQLKISGQRIMQLCHIPPGPQVGEIKKKLFEMVLENPQRNTIDELEQICRTLMTKE